MRASDSSAAGAGAAMPANRPAPMTSMVSVLVMVSSPGETAKCGPLLVGVQCPPRVTAYTEVGVLFPVRDKKTAGLSPPLPYRWIAATIRVPVLQRITLCCAAPGTRDQLSRNDRSKYPGCTKRHPGHIPHIAAPMRATLAGVSLRGNPRQRSCVTQFHIKVDGIEVETIRPGGHAHFDERAGEISRRLQRLNHRSALGKDVRKVTYAFTAVGEAKPQTMIIERPEAQHIDHRQVIRLHRGRRPFPAAC